MARLLLTLAVTVFFLLSVYGMYRGWRSRVARQSAVLPEFPQPPAGIEAAENLLPPATGLYVGTTTAGDWQDRIAVGDIGHRSDATLRLFAAGLLVERVGASPLWIPAASVVEARTTDALAGKVMGRDGLLVVSWLLGEHGLDTGFRGDEKELYQEWTSAVSALASANRRAAQ